MPFGAMVSGAAQLEFEAASRGSRLSGLTAILTDRQRMLLPLDDAVRAAGMDGQVDRGVREIPLARIRGSENRTRDRLWLDLDLEGQPAGPEHAADALLVAAKPYAPKRRCRHRRKQRAGFGAWAFAMARRR